MPKMILVPWDMMCDRTDRRTGGQENRRTGEQKGQENRKDKRTRNTGNKERTEKENAQTYISGVNLGA